MSEGTTPLAEPGTPVEPPTGVKRRAVRRWARRVLAVVVAVVAALFVTFFTIDLGRLPGLRQKAEQFGSQYLERPLHIGRISARVTPGDFVIENVVIEGLHPGDRPFMHIGRIDIHVPWWTLVHRQLHVTVRLTDWQMVVESWPGDIHNVPRLTHPGPSRRRSFTTTVDFVYAHGGTFTYEDHAAPWSVVAPNLDFDLVRAANLGEYVGHARFSGGTVRILDSLPMATAMTTRFVLDGSQVRLEHIDLVTDGSRSHLNGDVDFSHWPDQTYNVQSEVDFARMRSIFFQHESWSAGGTGTFTGVFRLTHEGPELVGDFESDTVDVDGLGFPDLHGSLAWTHDLFAVTHADSRLLGGHTRFSYVLAPLNRPGGATARFEADYEDANLFGLDRIVTLRGIRLAGTATGHLTMEWQNGRFSATRRARDTRRSRRLRASNSRPSTCRTRRCPRPSSRRPSIRTGGPARSRSEPSSAIASTSRGPPSTIRGRRPRTPTWPFTAASAAMNGRVPVPRRRATTGRRATACWPPS